MSADSPRRTSGSRGLAVPATVPPQVVSDRSILDSAIGFINDVTLVHQPITDPKDTITWARFETAADVSDPHFGDDWELEGNAAPPLLLILGYGLGVQVWAIPANGEAVEVLSWRHGVVSSLRILPTPTCASALDDNGRADERIDAFAEKRPLIALVDGGTGAVGGATGIGGGMGGGVGSMGTSPQFCAVNFISLKTGGQVKTIKFKNPVLDIQANRSAVAITFHERIAIFDARTLEDRLTVISCYPSPGINPNPIALGPRWLAYAEHKIMHTKRSGGGCDGEGVPSYTATVLNAAKSFGKGLRELGEQMAAGLTGTTGSAGSSKSSSFDSTMGVDAKQPGVVTIIDTKYPIKDYSPTSGTPTSVHGAGTDPIVAHFVAHTEALVAMEFDSSGMLLLTADRRGHDFHVFRVQPHPVGSSLAAVHHLYVLHRGDTSAKVQNIAFSLDSRWVAVSTLRGTTHVFPITPYGGAMGVRTHTSLHVVNKLSRFHRSAGLSADGRSSSPISHSESTTFMQSLQPYHNPTLPPFPRPTVVQPLTQLRQPFALGSPPGSAGLAAVSGKLGGVGGGVGGTVGGASQRQRLSSLSDDSGKPLSVCAIFAKSRSWLLDPPNATREAPHRIQRKAVDSLFVMAGHGALIQYDLDTKLASNVAKEKICDDTPIELEVEAKAQWNLGRRKDGSQEIVPPLALDNWLIKDRHACMLLDSAHNFDDADDRTESWLSQVEIITHAGPHRRLWMGPQFVFKNYNTPSGSNLNHVDTEAVEIGVAKSSTGASAVTSAAGATIASIGGASNTAATASAVSAGSSSGGGGMGNMSVRNERSSPLNMPLTAPGRAAGVPVLIESGSYSSIEQSPKLMDRFRHGHLDSDFGHGDIRLKEDLADAMRESPSASAARRETGRLLLSYESAAHAVSAASAVAATTSNAASSENAYFYDALTEHDDANENDDDDNDDNDDDDNNNDEENDDDDDNDENIGGINDSNNDKKQNASGNNKKNSRRFNQKVGSTNATGAAVVSKSNVVVVAQKTSGSKARPTTIAETTSAKLGSTGSAASASAAALATALPNIYSYDHNSGNSSAKNNNKTNSSTAAKIEKIVNPLGTVTTITAGITSDVQTDVLDEVVGQLAAEDCIIHENCDEALFRPVVAIFCNDREEMQRSEKSKQVAEHCKPPVVITNKLIVPVIAKEVDDVLTQKEKQQKSNVKSKQQRQQQLQLQQAERKQAEQQQQQRFDELSNLSKRCKDNNSSSKAKSEVSHTPSVTRQRQAVATATAKPTWEQSNAADSGLKYGTPKLEEHSEEKEKDKQRRDSLEVSLDVLKPSTAKGTDDETNNKKKEQKTAQRVPTKTATVAKGAAAEPKTPSMSKLDMKTVAVTSTKAVADTAASVSSTKATTKTSKITGDKEEDDSEKKTEKTHEPLPERITQIKTNILDVANLVDSLRDIRSNDDDDNDIKADEEAKKSSELQVDNSPDTLDTSVELLAKLKVSKKPNNKKDKKNNVSKPNSSSDSELKAEDISTSIRLNKDTSAQQDDESVGEDLADNLLEQKSKIAKTMISSATAKGLKIEIETRQDQKLTQRKQSAAQTDNDKAINMEVDTVEEKKNSKHNVLKMTVNETKAKDQKIKQETTQNEKVDVKRQSGGSGGSGVTDGSEDDTTIVKITNGKQETAITATKQTTPKKHAGKAVGDQAALLQDKKLATMPAKSAGALTSTTVTKKAGLNEAPKTYTVKVIEERSSSTDSTNSSNSSGNEGKAVNEKQLSPNANKKQNKLKTPETNSVKIKTEETLTQSSRVSTPTVASAWKNLSGAEVLSRNVSLNTSTDVSDYPSLASSTSPAKKPTKLSALPEMKSEISEKLLPSLPTPMKPAVVAPVSLSSPQEFKEPFSKTLTSTNTSLSGKKSKKIVEGNSGHFDDFLLLKPLESLPPLPALEPLEVLTKTIAESEANGKSTTLAEQMSLINFESPLQENPALQRKITPPPRGFSEQNLIFALCGSLHYENEFAKSADESATSVVKHNVPTLSSSKSTSSSNNSSGSEEIIVVEEPKKLSKKHKRSKQQLEQLQKQRNEQSLPSAAATAADDDDELRPLISMSDSQLDSYAETPAGQQLTANEELLQFSDLTCKTSSKRDAANASPLAQSTSTTTDSEGPIPATTSDDNLYMPAATSAATPHKLKTKKLEHKINLIAAIEAATSSSTSSAEESSVETGGPSSGSTLIGDTISGAGTGTGALNGLGVDTHSKGTGHSASVLGGTLPLSAVMSSSGGIATTTGGGGVGAVVNSAAGNQQSATKKKTKRRKR